MRLLGRNMVAYWRWSDEDTKVAQRVTLAKDVTVEVERDVQELARKGSGRWRRYRKTAGVWSVSIAHLWAREGVDGRGADWFTEAVMEDRSVTVSMYEVEKQGDGSWRVVGEWLRGEVVLTSVKLSAPVDGFVEVQVEGTGVGEPVHARGEVVF